MFITLPILPVLNEIELSVVTSSDLLPFPLFRFKGNVLIFLQNWNVGFNHCMRAILYKIVTFFLVLGGAVRVDVSSILSASLRGGEDFVRLLLDCRALFRVLPSSATTNGVQIIKENPSDSAIEPAVFYPKVLVAPSLGDYSYARLWQLYSFNIDSKLFYCSVK